MNKLKELKEVDWRNIDWQAELKQNINSIDGLQSYIDLSSNEQKILEKVADKHPMNIPRYYLSLISENDPNDPIWKLALPSEDELVIAGAMGETTNVRS